MIRLPPLKATIGHQFSKIVTWKSDGALVDLSSGWTATFTIKKTPCEEAIVTATPTLNSVGEIAVDIDDTTSFPTVPGKVGYTPAGIYEFHLVSDSGDGETFQGTLLTAGRI